jgi:hypothetical protein
MFANPVFSSHARSLGQDVSEDRKESDSSHVLPLR